MRFAPRTRDEALALVNRERSGQARFAGSEVHQPTLIENEVVELQVVRDGRLGLAASNRTDDDALKALAARAGEAADSAPADPAFAGFAPAAELPPVEGYDDETASLPPRSRRASPRRRSTRRASTSTATSRAV